MAGMFDNEKLTIPCPGCGKEFVEALAKLKDASVEAAAVAWPGYTDEMKTRIRSNPQIKALIAEARAAKARAAAGAAPAQDLPDL